MSIGWHSQPFPPSGASTAEGIRNQLGRPALNMLTVLVREAAQNSSDAALGGHQVRFTIDLEELSTTVAPRWRDTLLRGAPSNDQLPLRKSLQNRIRVLSVTDRGTRGLGGPTRADNAVTTDNDFVAFVRNAGEPRNVDLGGGTYGFGKGIFFLLSRCGTVLIYTRCRVGRGRFQTRLIVCSLWYSYTQGEGESGCRFTGRHWWGDTSGEVLEPLIDDEADRVARSLGLREFTGEETGTTISIIDPILDFDEDDEDRSADSAARWMADAIAWNLWPKMITHTQQPKPAMLFTVHRNGADVNIPDPAQTSPLHMFVSAFRSLKEGKSTEIRALRPKKLLGEAHIDKRFSQHFEASDLAEENGFGRTCNHICLMRSPELVVKYHRGPQTGSGSVGYAGVFRADDAVDDVFAQAEPPTHDDWVPANLEGHARTFVRVAFTRLKEQANTYIEPVADAPAGAAASVPLGDVSRRFADLVAGASPQPVVAGDSGRAGAETGKSGSNGAGAPQTTARHRAATSRPRVSYDGDPVFGEHSGRLVVIQKFRVSCSDEVVVSAKLSVTLPGAREKDAPAGAAVPTVVGWTREDGGGFTSLQELTHPGDDSPRLLLVAPAPDAGTSIAITANRAEA
ncbi:hypothetical protein [Tomitella fengzijianii]|uniref:Uncharacterized protein n=1 Tax=Tomitella fengzijianii TaxID=2597660 RepID=A0A516WZV6_9ACTN|nr:hypothetical protein [Tomitella fengzijianii]QDQ96343.1 hypothetical protein FO059_02005 [Tomitella fengzijianii]